MFSLLFYPFSESIKLALSEGSHLQVKVKWSGFRFWLYEENISKRNKRDLSISSAWKHSSLWTLNYLWHRRHFSKSQEKQTAAFADFHTWATKTWVWWDFIYFELIPK